MEAVIRVGILTVSDRASKGEYEDKSGPAVAAALPGAQFAVILQAIVPDSIKQISRTLSRWCDEYGCDVVLTTGGTGFAPRDITPEATRAVLERLAPNITQFLLLEGLKQTPFAPLSRGVAGMRGKTLIVNLPGSPGGASDGTASLVPLVPHIVATLRDKKVHD